MGVNRLEDGRARIADLYTFSLPEISTIVPPLSVSYTFPHFHMLPTFPQIQKALYTESFVNCCPSATKLSKDIMCGLSRPLQKAILPTDWTGARPDHGK
ncbi:hypothetical protein J22TS3_23420 [Paenibacillus sp. J22TS3]|nr:hypothetical protein J22TS3_23420 [Paenibacillus sp. J22TS3]